MRDIPERSNSPAISGLDWQLIDWEIHCWVPLWLDLCGHGELAETFADSPPVRGAPQLDRIADAIDDAIGEIRDDLAIAHLTQPRSGSDWDELTTAALEIAEPCGGDSVPATLANLAWATTLLAAVHGADIRRVAGPALTIRPGRLRDG